MFHLSGKVDACRHIQQSAQRLIKPRNCEQPWNRIFLRFLPGRHIKMMFTTDRIEAKTMLGAGPIVMPAPPSQRCAMAIYASTSEYTKEVSFPSCKHLQNISIQCYQHPSLIDSQSWTSGESSCFRHGAFKVCVIRDGKPRLKRWTLGCKDPSASPLGSQRDLAFCVIHNVAASADYHRAVQGAVSEH